MRQLSAWIVAIALASFAQAQGIGPHLGVGHLAGEAAGLDDGYTSVNGFAPLWQPTPESLIFFDASYLQYNQGSDFIGGNLGVGARQYSSITDSILGGYVYYDHRRFDSFGFDQVGCGVESLGRKWDTRFNVNAPVGGGSQEVLDGTSLWDYQALTVVDAETGLKWYDNGSVQLRTFIGVYGLFDGAIDDTAGVRGRIEARIRDQVWIGGFIEHDDIFDTTGGLTCEVRFGRRGAPSSSRCLASRLGDPVQRRKYIAVTRGLSAVEPGEIPDTEIPPLETGEEPSTPIDETPTTPTSGLPGDFNNDGAVDSADYSVWRDNLGQPETGGVLNNNGNGGVVDQSDYDLWLGAFTASAGL